MAVARHPAGEPAEELRLERVAQRSHGGHPEIGRRDLAGLPKPGQQEGAFRARAPSPFVPRAVHERFEPQAGADVESADPLGSVELVRRDGQQVGAELPDPGGDLPHRLRRVEMERNAARPQEGRRLLDRQQRAGLVVRVHHRDQHGAGGQRRLDLPRIDAPMAVYGEDGHDGPQAFEESQRLERRRMLHGGGHEVRRLDPAPAGLEEGPLDRQVARFAAAAGEDDLLGRAVEQRRRPSPRQLHGRARGTAGPVSAGRVAEVLLQQGPHLRGNLGVDRTARVVVQVDPSGHGHPAFRGAPPSEDPCPPVGPADRPAGCAGAAGDADRRFRPPSASRAVSRS